MRIALLALLAIAVVFGGWKIVESRREPPDVAFVRVVSGPISSEVSTNGKVDPAESAEARAEASGRVDRILIALRQNVNAGDPLVELDTANLRQELSAIQARIDGVDSELAVIDAGGRNADKVALQTQIDQATEQLTAATDEYNREVRLELKQATTHEQVLTRKNAVDNLTNQIRGFEQRKRALVSPADRGPLESRKRESEIQEQQTQLRIQQSTVRAPIGGTIYKFDLKPGAYLNPGDIVATIGRLDQVHVLVYVDEPDLGRVRREQAVSITWDAMPNREWKGTVDRLPTQIQPLDTRQVGEVTCVIENPNLDLLPGTNVTARILTEKVENALTIPKEAIFREGDKPGVYLLAGDHLEWHNITQGINNVTHVEVRDLKEGDMIALPSEHTLSAGLKIHPVIRP